MNEIGGYIELETRDGKPLHNSAIAINSGRNGIRYAIKAYAIKDLWVPTILVLWSGMQSVQKIATYIFTRLPTICCLIETFRLMIIFYIQITLVFAQAK